MDENEEEYVYSVNSDNMSREEESSLLEPSRRARSPNDRGFLVFLIFGFLGLASLLPWNFFITANSYFMYKFRNTSLSNRSAYDESDNRTNLQSTFESYLSIVSNGSNLFFMILTTLLMRWIAVKKRIIGSIVLVTTIFIATTAMVKVNTDSWQVKFLMLTLVMAALMSGGQSVLTGSVLGLSATFPVIYSQSAMIGQAAGGTFSAVASILTHLTGGGPLSSGFIYFLIAIGTTVLALLAYISLFFIPFSKFYMENKGKQLNLLNSTETAPVKKDESKVKFLWVVFKKTWVYCVSSCLVFFVTLAVFPAVCSLIVTVDSAKTLWGDTYFTPVVCFLFFNLGDFIGRLLTFVCKFPGSHRPRLFLFLNCLRIAFIPLIMLCNTKPRHHLPVVFDDDAYPIILISTMGLSNGYLGTLCMSFGPIQVESEEAEGAGVLLALSMTVGLAGGSFMSILLVNLL